MKRFVLFLFKTAVPVKIQAYLPYGCEGSGSKAVRDMLVGEKSGPPVFDIAALLGPGETENRILSLLNQTGNW